MCVCYQQLRREVANFFLHRKSFSKTYFSSRNFPGRLSSTRADILLVLQARKWQINRNFMVFFQSNDESPSHCKKMIKLTLSLWLYSFKIKKTRNYKFKDQKNVEILARFIEIYQGLRTNYWLHQPVKKIRNSNSFSKIDSKLQKEM